MIDEMTGEQLGSGDTCDPGTKLCCGTIALVCLSHGKFNGCIR